MSNILDILSMCELKKVTASECASIYSSYSECSDLRAVGVQVERLLLDHENVDIVLGKWGKELAFDSEEAMSLICARSRRQGLQVGEKVRLAKAAIIAFYIRAVLISASVGTPLAGLELDHSVIYMSEVILNLHNDVMIGVNGWNEFYKIIYGLVSI